MIVPLCPSAIHTTDPNWPAAEATITGTYAEQPRLGGTRRAFCQRCADLLEDIGVFTPE
jgi:hypothetical protein